VAALLELGLDDLCEVAVLAVVTDEDMSHASEDKRIRVDGYGYFDGYGDG
jgi:hypothetical protein